MSARPAQFDAETGRSVPPGATQARSRSERRYEGSREGRGAHRTRMGASEVEPTEVSISHKKVYGKTSEKAQLKISKARSHGSHVSSSAVSESPQPSQDYVTPHLSGRNTQDYSPKSTSSLYASTTADSERTKFTDNIPGIPASEQLTQRGDRAGHTLFPPPSVSNYGQNVTYPSGLSSDVNGLPRDTINTSDSVFCKAPTNRHSKSVRVKSQAETEMQWNATQENSYRPRDDQRNRPATNEFHHSTRTRGRRNKDGGSIVYNEAKFSGSSRQNVARRSTSTSYSESPTDSHGSSTESESDISSSLDTPLKRRRRIIRRKPSNKSIGSSAYGDDNTSESENHSVSEVSDTNSAAFSQRKRRTQFPSDEPSDVAPVVSYKELRIAANKIRSSSLTSVSSLEGAGISGDTSRIQSPLLSPKGTNIAKVRKVQIRSFTSFADSHLNNKENQPQRRRSTEERESFKIRGRSQTESSSRELSRDRTPLTRQGSESPSLSKNPFSLKSKQFVRRSSKDSLFSDSECNNISPDRGLSSSVYDVPFSREQEARCNSAPPAPTPIDNRESRLHSNLPADSGLASPRSAFVPVKPNKRTINDHEPNPPVAVPVAFADSRPEKGNSTSADVLLQPVPRHGNRPLSIVQETDEFVDIQEDEGYEVKKVEKMSKKSHVSRSSPIRTSQDNRTTSPSAEDTKSTLRRLSYVRAQKNSAELPMQPLAVPPLNNNSNSDSSPPCSPVPSSRRYNSKENGDTKRILKEFDPVDPHEIIRTVAPPVVAEGDLISFDDENGEVKEPVKKRTKRISRPKIPTILSAEEEEGTNDVDLFDTLRGMVEEGNGSYNKEISGLFDGSNRDTIIAHDTDEDSTPRAASDTEENDAGDSLGYHGGNELEQGLVDSFYHSEENVFEDLSQKFSPRRRLQKRASLPLIKTELYQDEAKKVEDVPKMEVAPESPSLRKAETISDLSLDEVSRHLKVIPYNSGDLKQHTDSSFQDDKSLESCSPPPGSVPSPSPSQISFDALSLTTSGFSESHSEQISTGDLNAVDDLLGMDAAANVKSLDAWRSQSDPSHGTQLEDTIAEAELQAHRNSNSEPNLSGEKLKEEAVQLAKRVNGGNQVEPKGRGITGHDDDDNDDDKETSLADLSPDDGCYELDKPEHRTKPVQRAKSAPTPTTPTTPRSQRIANSFAVEKAQVKLNKLAAMETIIEMPHAEPAIIIEKPKVEKKRSTSVEGSCASPAAVPKEDKRKLSVTKEPGKAQKSKHMPPGSRLQSYAPDVVNGKAIFFTILASFLAVNKGQVSSASTPSLASSVNLQTYSAVSPSGNVSPTQTSVRPFSTASPNLPRTFQISIHLSQTPWHEDLYNKQSSMFVALATNLTTAVSDALKNCTIEVIEFKPGSVIAVLRVTTLSSNEKDIKSNLTEEMKDGQLGGFFVDPTVYSGTLFEVVLRVVSACNDSLADKGFPQKDEFEKAVSNEITANPEFLGASIQRIDCSAAGNITIVTARVQIGGPSAFSPYKELSRLRSQVDVGRVGKFTVVPEWKSYTLGEKVFYVYVTLQTETVDSALTRKQLEQFVESEFKSENNFRYVHATTPDSKTAIIEIGMASSTPELLSLALSPLASDLSRAKLGNVTVVKKENRVTVHTRSLTRKIFEVTFVQYVSSCDTDSNNLHHKNLSQGFWEYIDETMRANTINEVYLESKVITIKCQNATTLRGFAYIYLTPTAPDNIGQFVRPFYKCKTLINIYNAGIRITLKTPTQPVTQGKWSPALGGVSVTYVCPKPKPKPPTTPPTISTATTPTPQPTSTPSTTRSSTTEASLSSTEKTTDEPSSATEPTHPPEKTTPTTQPTTTGILPTLVIEPELYVKLKLGLTWGEFCAKRDALKENIAWNVRDSNDTRVSPDRIVYINVERNCADPGKKDELAVVWFYVSESGSKEVHKDLTLKVYKLFKMFFENANTKPLGQDFEEKVVQVELAGNEASNYENETDCKMASWMIILLAIAGAVGLFLMLLACCCLFCCGVRRRRRRRKYGTEHPQALHVVHVDSNGQASGATKEKEQKNGIGNGIKKAEEDDGKNVKEHGEKDAFKNDGYESDSKDKSETRQTITDGKGNLSDQGDKSPTRKPTTVHDESSNGYGSLNKTDGFEEHTYASLNMAGREENSRGTGDNNNSAGYIAMTAPVSNGGIDRSGDRGVGADSKSKDSGSSDVNSTRAGKGGESPNSGSKPRGASLIKADAGPKGGERRGSNVYYSSIDDDVPLTHKTGTVGIVALAIRNKNETKKEREFKNLDKDVLNEVVKYPPETAGKNRFPDVLPAPRTRVKLSTSPDYINANWIRDHKGQISYIATQHPLHETTEDFWRMVWDQKAHTVVMVNDEEKEKPADFVDYLPKGQGNSKQFGGISVTVKQITEKADYVLTILSIVDGKKAVSPREVSHMRFTSWKERAMPNVALFVGFVTATREARKKHGDTKAPTIVHCSDGLGFSGVYIAVDIGIKSNEESKTSVVDVFELSKNLRRDRHGIVCTLEHYNFIYQALYEYTVNYNESIE